MPGKGERGGCAVLFTQPGKTGSVSLLSAPPFLLRHTPPPQSQAHPCLMILRDAVRTEERENGEEAFAEANQSYLGCHSCFNFIPGSIFLGTSKVGWEASESLEVKSQTHYLPAVWFHGQGMN